MFEFLSIVCTAAALAQGSCMPDVRGEPAPVRPDTYEMRVEPGMWQLSYSGNPHDFGEDRLAEHWRRRAAQLCAGDYRGDPVVQLQYPEPGYDAMLASLSFAAPRTFNVEAFGVAHCVDRTR